MFPLKDSGQGFPDITAQDGIYSGYLKQFATTPGLLSINFACLLGCLYPINVKTAESFRQKFCVGLHVAPRKVYELSKFHKFASIKIRFSLNF